MALTQTLTDNFDDNSLSASWSQEGDATKVLEQNKRIEVSHTATSQYNALNAASAYDLTGSYVYCKLVDAGNQALVSHECIFGARIDTNNGVWISVSNGSISAFKKVTGTQTQVGSSLTYSSTTHAWLRVREAGGTTFWDTSTDGQTWTNRWSATNPITVTSVKPYMQSGCWQNEASGSFGYFDNFNTSGQTGGFFTLM